MSWKRRWNQLKNLVNIDTIQLNTSFADGHAEGRLQWNSEDGTIEYGLPGGNVNLQVGQEQVIRAKNDQGSTILNGKAVYVSGATGSRPKIKLADNDTGNPIEAWSIGISTEEILNNQTGYITTFGLVRGVNTIAYSDGDFLWLDSTAGEVTNVRPDAPDWNVLMGSCLLSHATDGIIFCKIVIVPRLIGLSDVELATPNDGDIPVWVGANSRFELQQTMAVNIGSGDMGGGLQVKAVSANANVPNAETFTISTQIPSGAIIIGAQFRVNEALSAADNWDAEYVTGNSTQIAASQSHAKNTKYYYFFDVNASSNKTSAVTDVLISKSGGGLDFTAQGNIEVIVYYTDFVALDDKA